MTYDPGLKIWEKQSQFAEIQSIIQRLVKCTFFERLGWRRFPQLETSLKKLHDIVRDNNRKWMVQKAKSGRSLVLNYLWGK